MKMKKMFSTRTISNDTGLLILRILSGGAMLTHGFPLFQKMLQGSFEFGDPIGVGSELSLLLAVLAQFVCRILIIFGVFSRLALVPLLLTMGVAFFIIHKDDGFGDKELALCYLGMYAALFFTGPGKYSIDYLIENKHQFLNKPI